MKAAQYSSLGGPEVLSVTSDAPKPTAAAGQVLVEVHAAGLNPYDYKLRRDPNSASMLKFPVTIGGDLSGVITEVGEGVTAFKAGDEVYGQSIVVGKGSGSLAEFAVTSADRVAMKPQQTDFIQAAALVLVGSSAIMALEEHIKLQSSQKILIQGGAGGIGSTAVQLAKHLGAYVIATASTDDVEYVKSLGADEVIDYKTQDFSTIVKDLDAVFDTVGGETAKKSLEVLKTGGILVSMVGPIDEELAKQQGKTAIAQSSKVTTDRLNRLAEHVDQGAIHPEIAKVFPLDEARQAFEFFETSHPRGKVIVQVK